MRDLEYDLAFMAVDSGGPLIRPSATFSLAREKEIRSDCSAGAQALYVLELTLPPRPVQLVWKNSPRSLSTRS